MHGSQPLDKISNDLHSSYEADFSEVKIQVILSSSNGWDYLTLKQHIFWLQEIRVPLRVFHCGIWLI